MASAIKAQAEARGLPVTLSPPWWTKQTQAAQEREPPIGGSEHLREGEPPRALPICSSSSRRARSASWKGSEFAVLGLGDSPMASSSARPARDFDGFLAKAGAERIHELASLDVDYQDAAKAWGEQAVTAVAATCPQAPRPPAWRAPVQAAIGYSQYHKENPSRPDSVNQKITGRGFHQGYPSHRDQPEESGYQLPAGERMRSASGSTTTRIRGEVKPGPRLV